MWPAKIFLKIARCLNNLYHNYLEIPKFFMYKIDFLKICFFFILNVMLLRLIYCMFIDTKLHYINHRKTFFYDF